MNVFKVNSTSLVISDCHHRNLSNQYLKLNFNVKHILLVEFSSHRR